MKNKFFQFFAYLNTIDRRYIQWAYVAFTLSLLIVSPMNEMPGSGTR